jgi:arsenate reductase
MAEAFLRHYGGEWFEAYSAGLEPKGIHPMTRKVMAEKGFDLEGHRSKDVTEYMGHKHFGYLITVCAHAERNCPKTFPGVGQRLHWEFEDPAAFQGPEDEQLAVFRQARDAIEQRIQAWVASRQNVQT